MILVNNGMPKSGSTLLSSYIKGIINRSFPANGHDALCHATRSGQLKGFNGFVESIDEQSLPIIERIAEEHGPLTVKTHMLKNGFLTDAILDSRIRMVTTCRDPRDVLLSLVDHAARSRSTSMPVFQDCTDVMQAIPTAIWGGRLALDWMNSGLVTSVKYEILVGEPVVVIKTIGSLLGIRLDEETANSIILDELNSRKVGWGGFNKGKLSRFREEMSEAEMELCGKKLEKLILNLGYEL